jgi:D-arabinose 1-dehydrogenase-like Zn-dependent alcohol dehydrogenase
VATLTVLSTGTGFETSLALARNRFVICVCDLDMLSRSDGLIGAIINGSFAEYIEVPERNVFKIPYYIDSDLAASLACLTTPAHALRRHHSK